jgi:hypothetical protein
VVARVVVAVLAVMVVAWLAIMERDWHLMGSGARSAQHALDPRAFARADAAFRGAELLNPSAQPRISRAILLDAARRPGAQALVEDVLRREPDNLTAWGVLYTIARGHDPAAVRRALAAQRRLDPVSARRR